MNRLAFAVFLAVFKRTWLKSLRRPVLLTFSLVQPLMWMLFFGFLFQRYTLENMPPGIRYLDFLVPGICCMTVVFGASQAGIELIRDMQTHFLERVLATPAPKVMVMAGKICADASRLLVQAGCVLLLGLLLGASLHLSFGSLAQMAANLLLLAVAFCSGSCWIALKARSQENMATFVHLVNMPLLFTSTALVPSKQMPIWLAGIARFNPLSLAVNDSRAGLLWGNTPTGHGSTWLLLLLATLLFGLAVSAFDLKKA